MKKLSGNPNNLTKLAVHERVLSEDDVVLILITSAEAEELDLANAWGGSVNMTTNGWIGPTSGYYTHNTTTQHRSDYHYLVRATDYDAAVAKTKAKREYVDIPDAEIRVGDTVLGWIHKNEGRYVANSCTDGAITTIDGNQVRSARSLIQRLNESHWYSSTRVKLPRPGSKIDLTADWDWFRPHTFLALDLKAVDDIQTSGQKRAVGSATIVGLLDFQKLCATAREATNRTNETVSQKEVILATTKRAEAAEAKLKEVELYCDKICARLAETCQEATVFEREIEVFRNRNLGLLAEQGKYVAELESKDKVIADLEQTCAHARAYVASLEQRFKSLKTRRANAAKKQVARTRGADGRTKRVRR